MTAPPPSRFPAPNSAALTEPEDRASVFAALLEGARKQGRITGDYVVVGTEFTFHCIKKDGTSGSLETVRCEPTVLLRHRHGVHSGLLAYGLLHHRSVPTNDLGLTGQNLLSLPDETFRTQMLREAQAWFAEQEQERITRNEARAQRWWARVNGRSLLQVAVFLATSAVVFGLNRLLFPSAPFLLSVLIVSASLAVIVGAAWQLQLAVVPNTPRPSLLRAPTPARPPRTLQLIPGEYWHLRIVPTATTSALPNLGGDATPLPALALAAPEERVRRESLTHSRATLERSRAELGALRAQAAPGSSEARHADQLLARTDEALALVTRMERPPGLGGPLDDLERTIDTELNYLSALKGKETT